jgi:hypothetical protein
VCVSIEFDAGKSPPSPILAGTHQLPRSPSSGLRFTSKSFIALYRVCTHRFWRRETVAFAVTADSARYPIKLSDIDPAASDAAANHSLHRIRRVSVDLGAGKLSSLPSLPILPGTPSNSQILIQRPRMRLQIICFIVLGISPSTLAQGNCHLRHFRRFWRVLHPVLRYRSGGLKYTCELFVASYHACLPRFWCWEIITFAISANSRWYPTKFSDIDPAASNSPANHSLHCIRRVSVEIGAGKSSPLPSLPILAGAPSSPQLSIQRPQIHLRIISRIILCVSPSSLMLGNCRLRRYRQFWLALINFPDLHPAASDLRQSHS